MRVTSANEENDHFRHATASWAVSPGCGQGECECRGTDKVWVVWPASVDGVRVFCSRLTRACFHAAVQLSQQCAVTRTHTCFADMPHLCVHMRPQVRPQHHHRPPPRRPTRTLHLHCRHPPAPHPHHRPPHLSAPWPRRPLPRSRPRPSLPLHPPLRLPRLPLPPRRRPPRPLPRSCCPTL